MSTPKPKPKPPAFRARASTAFRGAGLFLLVTGAPGFGWMHSGWRGLVIGIVAEIVAAAVCVMGMFLWAMSQDGR